MPLSKRKRRLLISYRKWRDQGGPTIWGLIGMRAVAFLALNALFIGFGFFAGAPWIMVFAIGLFLGCLETDVLTADRVIRSWRMIADVVDWQRVDSLLAQDAEVQHRRAEEEQLGRGG
jgi:hypothetical protein